MQSNGNGGVNLPATLSSPTDQLSTTFTLADQYRAGLPGRGSPEPVDRRAVVCVLPQRPEQDQRSSTDAETRTSARLRSPSMASRPASLPFLPGSTRAFCPTSGCRSPAVQTLDFVPYRVNLTPFASLLSNGQPHTIALSVFNDDSYFSATASLLLFLDPRSHADHWRAHEEHTDQPISGGDGESSGNFDGNGNDQRLLQPQIHDCRIRQHIPRKGYYFSLSASELFRHPDDRLRYRQLHGTRPEHRLWRRASLPRPRCRAMRGRSRSATNLQLPDYRRFRSSPVSSSPFGITVATTQKYHTSQQVSRDGSVIHASSLTNSVNATDVSPASSSQDIHIF